MEQTAFEAFLGRAEAALPAAFDHRERDLTLDGRRCALLAGFNISSERKTFGIMSTGFFVHSHEERLFFPVDELTPAALADWAAYAARLMDARIQADSMHEFSIFSVILVTERPDRAVIRALRRADTQRTLKAPNTGWANTRFALVDLSARRIYTSPLGKPLTELLRAAL